LERTREEKEGIGRDLKEIPSTYLPGESEDNHEERQSGSRCSDFLGNFYAVQKIVTAHIGSGHRTYDLGLKGCSTLAPSYALRANVLQQPARN
jgi:hypothetical protein